MNAALPGGAAPVTGLGQPPPATAHGGPVQQATPLSKHVLDAAHPMTPGGVQ